MDTFSSVEYDQRVNQHHQQLDYGVETNDTALFDNIINSYEKADNELGGTIIIIVADQFNNTYFRAIVCKLQRAGQGARDACHGANWGQWR